MTEFIIINYFFIYPIHLIIYNIRYKIKSYTFNYTLPYILVVYSSKQKIHRYMCRSIFMIAMIKFSE